MARPLDRRDVHDLHGICRQIARSPDDPPLTMAVAVAQTKRLLEVQLERRLSLTHRALWSICEGFCMPWLRLGARHYHGVMARNPLPAFAEEQGQIDAVFESLLDLARQNDAPADALFLHAARLAVAVKHGDRRVREERWRWRLWLLYSRLGIMAGVFLTIDVWLRIIATFDRNSAEWVVCWLLAMLGAGLYAVIRDQRAAQTGPGP